MKTSENKELWISSLFIFSFVFIFVLSGFLSTLEACLNEIPDRNTCFWWIKHTVILHKP